MAHPAARVSRATAAASPPQSAGRGSPVADVVTRFAEAWRDARTPPDLTAFLPDSPALRRVSLIELIKVDLAQRWRRHVEPKRLAQYVAELPELRTWPLPPDLIYEEFHLRRQAGQPVDVAEYTATYPAQAQVLSELLTTDDYHSTLLAGPVEPAALDELEPGTSVDDFDLMTSLGRGAFARVFLARQRSMQRLVAVKISRDKSTEPQTLAQLDHRHIVRVFDQRVLPSSGLRLLYMQYVPGGTLFSVLERLRAHPAQARARGGALLLDVIDEVLTGKGEIRPGESATRAELAGLTWPETIAWLGRRLADALDYADRCGVLHRDIKPANVLLTAEGEPQLADFNISFGSTVTGASPVAYFGGSLAYMSPEQLAAVHPDLPGTAADLDVRSDLYALAVMLWELLTGHKPFGDDHVTGGDRTTLDGMLERRRRGPGALPYADLPPDCPAALRRTLARALDPDPARRWPTGADMAQQFDVCLDARARDLVDPSPRSARVRARAWLHPIMACAIAIPNALAILYSYQHNRTLIIDKLDAQTQQRFDQVALTTYGLCFLLGVVATNVLIAHLWSVSRGLRHGRHYDAATLAKARSDTLRLAQRNVLTCFVLWALAGIVVPLTVQVSGSSLPAQSYLHFFATQIVCGGIAMAYPYFLVSFYSVRCLYPMFVPHGGLGPADAAELDRLDRRGTAFLAVAAAVPLLGVAGATFIPPADLPAVIVPLRVLGVGSALAFVGVYWLFRMSERDLTALARVVEQR
ncbi:serine/threonine protein kinase [Nocardia farcinica]|uniref:serine/threonine-protein kinase n=1 Tax=Nocardia farcinica TaxID=37329 RepID=UPI0018951B35|nr:serine/threonine-protein kinase [Nocardia farcinica]MBF6260854.1 serine/threonine protein kinase [Nocardia farcinica]MBF6279476.1 serine/threonine protein kinase [Nocardia farcinica]MBF6303863.1 serine/threonine protein kinase [Nocardia farcinica]MBF6388906.1 serine/threonine protein kinase [Nocardia farcinica]MBF6489584.1 serine/threonine protein kinase [Nocardia farcinica]